MLSLVLSVLQVAAAQPVQTVYHARNGETSVRIPMVEAEAVIDGGLDESVWREASVLTGFSLYQPVDQRPAPDSTAVMIWYSPTAMYFGVRAFEPHGMVRATLADRDKVGSDDNIEIHLDTYNERNRALVFIVNPLGVQADGTKGEGGGFIPGANLMPGQNDLSADFIWESKGRLTDFGYEVEIRVPFSSMRYPTESRQNWGIQIQRRVQHSGYNLTWTPAIRAWSSFIDQEGLLVGLEGMHHGQVVQLNPELTNTVSGGPCCDGDGGWSYDSDPRLGGNVRWAIGSNFVMNGTVRPDFSQVEADATQIAADQRFALFYPERRPFFVEGVDQFNAPNTLVYTRTIVRPEAAAKVTGKVGRTDVALLAAVDDPSTTGTGERPRVGIVRIRRGFGSQSTGGVLYSERVGGGRANRVFDADMRYLFGGRYFAEFQGVVSRTSEGGVTRTAPMWEAVLDGTGRTFGFRYSLKGIDDGFAADNGFVRRTGIVQAGVGQRVSWYGESGALLERFNVFLRWENIWDYDDFFDGKSLLEGVLSAHNEISLRGGWTVRITPTWSRYRFDTDDYPTLFVGSPDAPRPFVPTSRIRPFVTGVNFSTPQFTRFSGALGAGWGRDVDFLDSSPVRRTDLNGSLNVRPTQQIRIGATYRSSKFTRRGTGEETFSTRIPRVRLEYQLTRSIFFRMVAQYTATERSALRDPSTGRVLLIRQADGTYAPSTETAANTLTADWLFSYRPTPGTVVFAGYGNTMTEVDPLSFSGLRRQHDAFFVKLSYLFGALGGA